MQFFQMLSSEARGLDGFGASFFQKHWPITANDITNCIFNFFKDGKILKEIKHTLIGLIAKVDSPTMTSQFRPTSLCNNLYKIISKILVNRMHPILDCILTASKVPLFQNEQFMILVAHEIMNKFNNVKGKQAYIALKLDMKNAYDRLE